MAITSNSAVVRKSEVGPGLLLGSTSLDLGTRLFGQLPETVLRANAACEGVVISIPCCDSSSLSKAKPLLS